MYLRQSALCSFRFREQLMIDTMNHGDIRELRLNRPPANALSPELIVALKQAVENAEGCGSRAIVLSGMPGMFSAGLDVPYLLTLDRAAIAKLWRDFYGLLGSLACSPIPIACAITGHAPAGGTVLLLFCDWRTMAEGNWKIGLNEVQVGLPVPPVILGALHRQIGARQAEQLATSGRLMSPEDALKAGLIDEIVSPERVIERASEWCKQLLTLPAGAMLPTRARARADLVALFEGSLQSEIETVTESWWTEDTLATLRAMAQRLAARASRK
jgi:Delta3-Delta2-enoyl-CoA isomerase